MNSLSVDHSHKEFPSRCLSGLMIFLKQIKNKTDSKTILESVPINKISKDKHNLWSCHFL